MADPKKTERLPPDAAYANAFDVWQVVQTSIHESWMHLKDLNNLRADLPKSFQDAAAFVRSNGGLLGVEIQSETLIRLRTMPSKAVSKAMRTLLSS